MNNKFQNVHITYERIKINPNDYEISDTQERHHHHSHHSKSHHSSHYKNSEIKYKQNFSSKEIKQFTQQSRKEDKHLDIESPHPNKQQPQQQSPILGQKVLETNMSLKDLCATPPRFQIPLQPKLPQHAKNETELTQKEREVYSSALNDHFSLCTTNFYHNDIMSIEKMEHLRDEEFKIQAALKLTETRLKITEDQIDELAKDEEDQE